MAKAKKSEMLGSELARGNATSRQRLEQRKAIKKRFLAEVFLAVVYVAVWLALIMFAIGLETGQEAEEIDYEVESVPTMEIVLNGVTLSEIQENGKDKKYEGNTLILDGEIFEDVEVKGRGNFSWAADKKSYRIKFTNKVDLLGIGKARKWALITNGSDDSLLRNDLARYLMGMIADKYPFRGDFVELTIGGEYLGLYYLTRTMNIDKQMVDLRDPMGVLVELDNVYCWGEEKWYETDMGNCLTLSDIVADDNAEAAMKDFVKDFNKLEKAAEEGDFEKAVEVADMKSFAEYFVISELTADPDAYLTSWYFYKDGKNDKIHTGLIWDFDASFGNRGWGGMPEGFYNPKTTMARMEYTFGIDEGAGASFCNYNNKKESDTLKISRMVCELMDTADFRALVGEVYQEKLAGREEEVEDFIDQQASLIWDAAKRNEERWGKNNFEEEVDYLKWWIIERMKFFEEKYVKSLSPSSTAAGTDERDAPAKMDEM